MTLNKNIIAVFAAFCMLFCGSVSASAQTGERAQNAADPAFAPNVITPNGDGVNDAWKLESAYADCEVAVYDRWSRKVYGGSAVQPFTGATNAGDPLPEGVYFYLVKGGKAGETAVCRSGSLTLLR